MSRKGYRGFIVALLLIMLMTMTGCGQSHKEGEPDVVATSITNFGEDYKEESMTVVANRNKIEDKESFASKLVDMYKENSFETVKFSTDYGYASCLKMRVYLWKDEIEGSDPVMTVEYSPIDDEMDCDVVNDPEKYQLIVDGEVAEYQSDI